MSDSQTPRTDAATCDCELFPGTRCCSAVVARELETELAAKDAELAEANESIDRVQSLHRELMMEADRRVEAAEDGLKQERAAREQVSHELSKTYVRLQQEQTACKAAEQRLAAVKEQLAGMVERCANVCEEISVSMHYMKAGTPVSRVDDAFDDAIRQCAAAIRALTAAPKEPAPVAQDAEAIARQFHDTYERLAPQFGYETRQDTRQFDPESANGKLMIAVCGEIYAAIAGKREGKGK